MHSILKKMCSLCKLVAHWKNAWASFFSSGLRSSARKTATESEQGKCTNSHHPDVTNHPRFLHTFPCKVMESQTGLAWKEPLKVPTPQSKSLIYRGLHTKILLWIKNPQQARPSARGWFSEAREDGRKVQGTHAQTGSGIMNYLKITPLVFTDTEFPQWGQSVPWCLSRAGLSSKSSLSTCTVTPGLVSMPKLLTTTCLTCCTFKDFFLNSNNKTVTANNITGGCI